MNVSDRLQQQQQLSTRIYTLCMESMRASQPIFPLHHYQELLSSFEQIGNNQPAVVFLEEFLLALINQAINLKHQLSLQPHNLSRQDYAVLELSLQKAQAEIRKHIKVQQQLKLYLDSLQEKIEYLEGQLQLESQKYQLLFDNFKELDQTHKKMQGQPSQSNQHKKLFASPVENIASRKTKLGLKSKMLMERLQQRARRANQHKKTQMLSITEDDMHVGVFVQQMPIKKSSIDRYHKQTTSHSSIKELTKSLQMKHQRSAQSYLRKCKQRTDSHKRESRSSSIMY